MFAQLAVRSLIEAIGILPEIRSTLNELRGERNELSHQSHRMAIAFSNIRPVPFASIESPLRLPMFSGIGFAIYFSFSFHHIIGLPGHRVCDYSISTK